MWPGNPIRLTIPTMSVRVAIIGPTGYTGLWLIRLLLGHPEAELTYLASHREQLPNIAEEFPVLVGRCEMDCRPIDPKAIARQADMAFVCLPHRAAMSYVPQLLDAGLRVVDLSADYRLTDRALYERVYETTHTDPGNLERAVYGLPELVDRRRIAEADLVANPGCYPTGAILALAPLVQRSLIKPEGVVVHAASGVTGAGRGVKPHLHYPEQNENYGPYAVGTHRHQPEIDQALSWVRGQSTGVLFVPHLLPIDVGILETIYCQPTDEQVTEDDLYEAYAQAYAEEPFVRVRRTLPSVKQVRDTNFCDVAARLAQGRVVLIAAIDNMVKGASGQAIQNMNLMFSLDETAGLW